MIPAEESGAGDAAEGAAESDTTTLARPPSGPTRRLSSICDFPHAVVSRSTVRGGVAGGVPRIRTWPVTCAFAFGATHASVRPAATESATCVLVMLEGLAEFRIQHALRNGIVRRRKRVKVRGDRVEVFVVKRGPMAHVE